MFPFRIKITSQKETMLVTHMLALCLHVDDFATDTMLIAHDLKMPVSKYVFVAPDAFFLLADIVMLVSTFCSRHLVRGVYSHEPDSVSFSPTGCNIRKLDHKDLKKLGLPDSAAQSKRAILDVPVKFPQPRRKRAGR